MTSERNSLKRVVFGSWVGVVGGWDNGAVRGEEGEGVVFRAEDGGIV